jgi:DNA-binding NtrC family response regulator
MAYSSAFPQRHQICIFTIIMDQVLLCTHNPILIKNVYGILRDEGFTVEVVDHSALAVQRVFQGKYGAVIIDAKSFGLSAEDAVQIIKSVSPDIVVICVGFDKLNSDVVSMNLPVDLEEFKQAVHDVRRAGAGSRI